MISSPHTELGARDSVPRTVLGMRGMRKLETLMLVRNTDASTSCEAYSVVASALMKAKAKTLIAAPSDWGWILLTEVSPCRVTFFAGVLARRHRNAHTRRIACSTVRPGDP